MKRAVILCALLCGCPASSSEALDALADEGLTDAELGGPVPIFSGCSDDQDWTRSFVAMRGDREVDGVVCCSLFACSVRYQ